MDVGISGTRNGANDKQLAEIKRQLLGLKAKGAVGFRHGDCIGVDAQAVEIARSLGYKIIKHPGPTSVKLSANTKADETFKWQPYLQRNRKIVDRSQVVLIVPEQQSEQVRSGTWSTYRYCKKTSTKYVLISPER